MTGPGGRVLMITSGTRTSKPARRLDQLYAEYIHACKIPFYEVGKKIKEIFLGVRTGGHDQLHDRRNLLLFLLLFCFFEVDIHAKSALRD